MKRFNTSVLLSFALLGLAGCSSRAPEAESAMSAAGEETCPEVATVALDPAELPALKAWLERQDSGWQPRAHGRRHVPVSLQMYQRRLELDDTQFELVGNTLWMQDRWKTLAPAEMDELWQIIRPIHRVRDVNSAMWAM